MNEGFPETPHEVSPDIREQKIKRDRNVAQSSPLSAALFTGVLVICMLISAFLRFVGPSSIPQHHHHSNALLTGQ